MLRRRLYFDVCISAGIHPALLSHFVLGVEYNKLERTIDDVDGEVEARNRAKRVLAFRGFLGVDSIMNNPLYAQWNWLGS